MTDQIQKHQIVKSLDSLDHDQTDKVLEYIKGLLHTSSPVNYKMVKREAMKQIKSALKKKSNLNLTF